MYVIISQTLKPPAALQPQVNAFFEILEQMQASHVEGEPLQ